MKWYLRKNHEETSKQDSKEVVLTQKGKTFKICWEAECQPFKRLFKEETEILQQEDDLQIRLLRPKENKITEVEICDSKSIG